ncbi:hypothetical protein [Spirosoma arcticum]
MNKLSPTQALGWLSALLLLFSWNLQAEVNPSRIAHRYLVQSTESCNVSTLAIDPVPISLTATAGTPFTYVVPLLLPIPNAAYTATGLPANGLSLGYNPATSSGRIEGTPTTAGVLSVTVTATGQTSNPAITTAFVVYTITINPAVPTSLTATAGTPFTYVVPLLLPIPNAAYTATGLPANGLSLGYNPATSSGRIEGTPTTAGVLSVTVTATGQTSNPAITTAFVVYTITINPAPGTPPTNNPPVAPSIPSQTATVGIAYFQNTPSFTDPDGQAIAVQAFGLPPGLSYTGTASGIVAGTPTTAGVYSVSLVGTDLGNGTITGGLSATAVYIITVSPALPGSGSLTLLAPTYNCTTGAFTFNTSGGDGSPITFAAIGITSPTTNPNQFVDQELRTAADAPLITLSAIQNGTLVTYVWNIRAQCPVGPGTEPITPPGGGALTLLAPTYNCTTGAFTFNTSGGSGSPITYAAIGITGPTTNPNQFVDTGLRTAPDAPLITLSATQNGTTVTYLWNIRAQCPVGPGTPPINPPVGSALVLLAPTYNCATGAFTFNTSGGNGNPIEYRAVPGITDWTTNLNQFVDEGSRTANDVQPFLLEARQNGVVVSLVWNLKAACGRARLGAGEPERRLRVIVLGNPVVGETVQVEVSGAEDLPLRVTLTNLLGGPVSEERIGQAAAMERISVKLGRSGGVYLLKVSSPSQTNVVRVLKTE